eukprot:1767353-Karenia_brevis.AAC.1
MDDLWPAEWPWALLDAKLPQRSIDHPRGLMRAITEEWQKVNPEQCQKLLKAVPSRLKDIIKVEDKRLLTRRTAHAS